MKSIWIPLLVSIAFVSIVFASFENLETYFEGLLIKSQNNTLNYAFISFLVLSSDILLPVPSSIVMYTNGLVLGFFQAFGLSLLASLVSSCIGYYLGRFSSFGKKQTSPKVDSIIKKYGSLSIILTRGIPILSESTCFTAGYNSIKFSSFFILNAIGYLPVVIIYSYFGTLGQGTHMFLISFAASLILSALLWIFGRKLLSNE